MLISPSLDKLPLAIERSHDKEMLSIRMEGQKTIVRVNYSSLSILQECPRKSQFTFIDGLRAKMDSPATLFGGAVHKALETFYSAPREERLIPRNFNEMSDLMAYGNPAATDELLYRCIGDFVEHAAPLRGLADTDKRSLSSGIWMLQHYFKTYISDPWEVLLDENGPIVERRCEIELYDSPELKIIAFGTIDVILRNAQTGVILAADHKTSSIIGNDFYNRLVTNLQYSLYDYCAKNVLKLNSTGFLVNCLEVKARPLTARGGPPKFIRQVTTRSIEQSEEMIQTFITEVKGFLQNKENNFFPLGHVNACASYGGCQFLDVCGSPSNIRPSIIDSKFMRVNK